MVFVELPAFARLRADYLDDEAYRSLQSVLLACPTTGSVIEGTGGLRKARFGDARRGKGKRGGLRVIYHWWQAGQQIWLFTLYDKDEATDLTASQRDILRRSLFTELQARDKGDPQA